MITHRVSHSALMKSDGCRKPTEAWFLQCIETHRWGEAVNTASHCQATVTGNHDNHQTSLKWYQLKLKSGEVTTVVVKSFECNASVSFLHDICACVHIYALIYLGVNGERAACLHLQTWTWSLRRTMMCEVCWVVLVSSCSLLVWFSVSRGCDVSVFTVTPESCSCSNDGVRNCGFVSRTPRVLLKDFVSIVLILRYVVH